VSNYSLGTSLELNPGGNNFGSCNRMNFARVKTDECEAETKD
jgi:hypothetical protein